MHKRLTLLLFLYFALTLSTVTSESEDMCNATSLWPAYCQLINNIPGGLLNRGDVDFKVNLPHHYSKGNYTLSLWRLNSFAESQQCICNCKGIADRDVRKTLINKAMIDLQQNDARQELDCKTGCYQFSVDEDETLMSCCFYLLSAVVPEGDEGSGTLTSEADENFPVLSNFFSYLVLVGIWLIILCTFILRSFISSIYRKQKAERVDSILLIYPDDSGPFLNIMTVLYNVLKSTVCCEVYDPCIQQKEIYQCGESWLIQKLDICSKVIVVESKLALLLQNEKSRESNVLNNTLKYFYLRCLPKLIVENPSRVLFVRLQKEKLNKSPQKIGVNPFIPSLLAKDWPRILLPDQLAQLLRNLGCCSNTTENKQYIHECESNMKAAWMSWSRETNQESLFSVSM